MRYISEKEYNAEMLRIKHENESKARLRKLKAERAKGRQKKSRSISNSKLVLWAMVILVFCIAIWFMYEGNIMAFFDELKKNLSGLCPARYCSFSRTCYLRILQQVKG